MVCAWLRQLFGTGPESCVQGANLNMGAYAHCQFLVAQALKERKPYLAHLEDRRAKSIGWGCSKYCSDDVAWPESLGEYLSYSYEDAHTHHGNRVRTYFIRFLQNLST